MLMRLWAIQTRRNWMNAKPRRGVHCPTGVNAELCGDNWWKRRVPWYSLNLKSSIGDGYPLYTSSHIITTSSFQVFLFVAIFKRLKKNKKKRSNKFNKKPSILPTSSLKNSNCWIHPSSTSSAGAPAWFLFQSKQTTSESQLFSKVRKHPTH